MSITSTRLAIASAEPCSPRRWRIRPQRATTGLQAPLTSRRLSILPTSGIWPSSSTKGSWRLFERRMRARGYLDARDMAAAFNMLRANDLIWSFVVSNYLLGKEQIPVDLFFWNSNSTRMQRRCIRFICVRCISKISWQDPAASRWRMRRSIYRKSDSDLHSGYARRPHCAVEIDCRDTLVLQSDQIRSNRCGPYGWRDQPTGQQVWTLGERQIAAQSRRMVRRRDVPPRVLVAGLGRMGNAAGPGPRSCA